MLADHDIPHLIVGGLAVQEYGYARVTIDVDIVVPDVLEAVELLTASLTGPFYRVPEIQDRVEDRRNGVLIDLLPAGKVLKRGCKVPFPQPVKGCRTISDCVTGRTAFAQARQLEQQPEPAAEGQS